MLGFTHSEESKEKMRGSSNHFYGKTHTLESRKKIGEARMGSKNPLYGKPKSPEFIAQQYRDRTGSNIYMSKKVYVYYHINNKNIFFKELDTIISVARYLDCSETTISRHCHKGTIYYSLKNNIY